MAEYSDIIKQVDSSLATFDSAALKAQKKLMEQVMLLSKELDTDSSGAIKTTISNLQKIAKIKAAISKIVCDDQYKDSVTKLCEDFEKVYQKQHAYYKSNFEEGTIGETAAKKQKLLRQLSVQNTIEGLTGSGINTQITDKLSDMLQRSVTSGALWSDMVSEMKAYLDPDGDGTGAFAKYAKTYATTAMGQFTGQNNKLMTDALDTEWYMYVGSDIETTREFCQHLTKKRYIHVSEIPTILSGDIDGHQCAIYAKTGLPQGMIEGTTPENFQVNVGGWNCRHQLLPVAEEAVPADIRAKFDSYKQEQIQKQKEEEERKAAEEAAKKKAEEAAKKLAQDYLRDFKGIAGADLSSLEDAYKNGRWEDVKSEAIKLDKIKQSIIELANNAMKEAVDFGGIDTSKLQSLLDAGELAKMQKEAKQMEIQIAQIKAAEKAISDLIPNAHTLRQSYSMEDLQNAHAELDAVMKKWLSKYSYSSLDNAPLQHLKNKLDFELTNPSTRYSNSDIIKAAIKEKMALIDKQIAWNDLVHKADSLKTFKTKSAKYKATIKKIEDAINSGDSDALNAAINEAELNRQKIVDQQIKRGGDIKTALNEEYKGGALGKDISSGINTSNMVSEDPYRGTFTNNVARMQGFDAPAKLVSESEFEILEKASGDVFYRTLNPTTFKGKKMSSAEFSAQLYKADLLELNGPGGRVYGDGMYVATSAWDGRSVHSVTDSRKRSAYNSSICYGNGNHTISEMTFTRKPKIIKQTELWELWRKLTPAQRKAYGNHENTYACALGYDAMYCDGVDYMVIWNRSIIAVKKR